MSNILLRGILGISDPGDIELGAVGQTSPFFFTADAVLAKSGLTGRFTVDAYLWSGAGTQTRSFTADAVLKGPRTSVFTINAYLQPAHGGSFTLDASLRGTGSGSFTISAILTTTAPPPRKVTIKVAGTDITNDVLIQEATFKSVASGGIGSCTFKVLDPTMRYAFAVGQEVTLDLGWTRMWGGYIQKVERTFPTSVMKPAVAQWTISGVDYNILFDKRVVRDLSNVNNQFLYPPGTYDDTIIWDMVNKYLDVPGDHLSYEINRVAIAILDIPGVTSGPGTAGKYAAASQGYTWRQVMYAICRTTGGIYYIDPSKTFVYCDVDSITNANVLSDQPGSVANGVGYRNMEILDDGQDMRNDAIIWGAGMGSNQVVVAETKDTTSVATHGLWQVGDFNQGIYRQASAQTIANTWVNGSPSSMRGGKNDKEVFMCIVKQPIFTVGQKVRCISNVFGFDKTLPIRSIETTFVNPNDAILKLTNSFDIDAPWSMFDIVPFNWDFIAPPSIATIPGPNVGTCSNNDAFLSALAPPHALILFIYVGAGGINAYCGVSQGKLSGGRYFVSVLVVVNNLIPDPYYPTRACGYHYSIGVSPGTLTPPGNNGSYSQSYTPGFGETKTFIADIPYPNGDTSDTRAWSTASIGMAVDGSVNSQDGVGSFMMAFFDPI